MVAADWSYAKNLPVQQLHAVICVQDADVRHVVEGIDGEAVADELQRHRSVPRQPTTDQRQLLVSISDRLAHLGRVFEIVRRDSLQQLARRPLRHAAKQPWQVQPRVSNRDGNL